MDDQKCDTAVIGKQLDAEYCTNTELLHRSAKLHTDTELHAARASATLTCRFGCPMQFATPIQQIRMFDAISAPMLPTQQYHILLAATTTIWYNTGS